MGLMRQELDEDGRQSPGADLMSSGLPGRAAARVRHRPGRIGEQPLPAAWQHHSALFVATSI